MKSSTNRIVETFPDFKGKLKAYENIELVREALKDLTEVEVTFLKLAWFFEAPEYESFNIQWLYEHLDDQWLELALELITQFFREDTYLIQKLASPLFIKPRMIILIKNSLLISYQNMD